MHTDADKVIVHLTLDDSFFLTDLQSPQCDVRVISEISSRKGLKDAYRKLGFVSDSTLFWLTLGQIQSEKIPRDIPRQIAHDTSTVAQDVL